MSEASPKQPDLNDCGCCEGIQLVTPESVANLPGQPALRYRVGTHNSFFESMLARLSTLRLGSEAELANNAGSAPLQGLTARNPDDPAIALLDAWATVGDVLTFYQERVANEGYLRTAVQRRSVLELARLVGYRLRPGVSASVYMAYEMEAGGEPSVIPRGAKVQSVPGPGEEAQTFETSADLTARAAWNNLKPRQAKPLVVTLANAQQIDTLYFTGTATNLKPNDPLLLVFDDAITHQVLRRVEAVKPVFDLNYSEVTLQPVPELVIILVDLLQAAVDILSAYLPKVKQDPALVKYLPWLEALMGFLKRVLENLRLGNYPPNLSKLSHDQAYGLLNALFLASAVNRTAEQPFLAFLVAAANSSLGPNAAFRSAAVAAGITWGNVFQDALTDPLLALIQHASDLLDDAAVQKEVTCTASNLVQSLAPAEIGDSLTLISVLSRFGKSSAGGPVIFSRTTRSRMQKSGLSSASSDLLSKLAGIPWETGADQQAGQSLDDLHALASDLASGKQDIPPFDQLRRKFVELDFAKALSAIESLQGGLKAINVTQDAICAAPGQTVTRVADLIRPLTQAPALHPISPAFLARAPKLAFRSGADAVPRMLLSFYPGLSRQLYSAWASARLEAQDIPLREVHALRQTTAPFGYNAPAKMKLENQLAVPDGDYDADEQASTLFLDSPYPTILPASYVVIRRQDSDLMAAQVDAVTLRPRTAYTISGKSTRLALSRVWWDDETALMTPLRSTSVMAQSEILPLADAPDPTPVAGDTIVLDDLYDGLDSGRWLIVSGERVDIPGVAGVQGAELVMLLAVSQGNDPAQPGDTHPRTTLQLVSPLSYQYRRSTVTVYGNVVKATHGETRLEVLGSGDASKPFQKFALRQPPLTYTAADTPSGAASSLQVRVNDLLWHESPALFGLGPADRVYLTKTDDAGQTTVIFGNGALGARPPSGVENITAQYRNGIGKGGNVRANQLTLMLTRPLHAKNVTNPTPASGGADPDTREQARRNVPKSVTALGRLVSVQDYADFASTFAGIGKASAARLSDGRRQFVYVTVAGIDDIPIATDSDLYASLYQALLDYGDPHLPVRLAVRDLLLMVISADISLLPDYAWEAVKPKLEAAMQAGFGFDAREMGQPIFLSQVTALLQSVSGVAYVDVQALDALDKDTIIQALPDPEKPDQGDLATRLGLKPRPWIAVEPARYDFSAKALLPAQIAYLTPDVPETLILNLREG